MRCFGVSKYTRTSRNFPPCCCSRAQLKASQKLLLGAAAPCCRKTFPEARNASFETSETYKDHPYSNKSFSFLVLQNSLSSEGFMRCLSKPPELPALLFQDKVWTEYFKLSSCNIDLTSFKATWQALEELKFRRRERASYQASMKQDLNYARPPNAGCRAAGPPRGT